MLFSRKYLPLLGSLLIPKVVAQNTTCNASAPRKITSPPYAYPQPFLPYHVPEGAVSIDDTSKLIVFKGVWDQVIDANAVGSALETTNDPSATLSLTFTGVAIEWFGMTGPDQGDAKVTLNSTPPVSVVVSLTSPTVNNQQRIWSDLELPLNTYTLTIENTKNKPNNAINVDAFVVTPQVILGPPRISDSGGWNFVQKGMTNVAAMQIAVISPTHAIIFDQVQHNYASLNGHPVWSELYNLDTGEKRPLHLLSNSFCASGSFLSNGTLISIGGNPAAIIESSKEIYHDINGLQSIRIVEPCRSATGADCDVLDMVDASPIKRWYPTVLRVTDGSALIVGGGKDNVYMNNVTLNQPSVSFFPTLPTSPTKFDIPFLNRTLNANLFVQAYSLPNKRAFVISNTESTFINWGASPPHEEPTIHKLPGGIRVTYPMPGAAVHLPLSAKDNYTTRILVCGGSDKFDMLCDWQYSSQYPASSQCSMIEIKRDGTTDGWKLDDTMPDGGRIMPDGVLLPTGDVVIVNGARVGFSGFGSFLDSVGQGLSNADQPSFSPLLYSPDKAPGQRFTVLGVRSDIPRMYHSVATLTPSGNIMIAGSNPNEDRRIAKYPTEYRVEFLNPPYMAAERPTYSGLAPIIGYGVKFTLQVNIPKSLDQSKIKVSLMDLGFSTHSMHANARLVFLESSLAGTTLTVSAPPDAGIYPPGPAFVYVVVDGVPSKADVTIIGDGKAPPAH